MITLTNLSLPAIQQALNMLEDAIREASTDVIMTVDESSDPIYPGRAVGMTANNTVALANSDVMWIGISVGPMATAGQPIRVRGGTPVEVFIGGDELPTAGNLIYWDSSVPGKITTVLPDVFPRPPAIGAIYDASGHSPVAGGGYVKALINSNFAGGFVPAPT